MDLSLRLSTRKQVLPDAPSLGDFWGPASPTKAQFSLDAITAIIDERWRKITGGEGRLATSEKKFCPETRGGHPQLEMPAAFFYWICPTNLSACLTSVLQTILPSASLSYRQ